MRRSSRSAVRWFAAGLTAAATAIPAVPAFSAAPTGGAAYTYATPQGEKYYAIAARATDMARAHRPADRHVILVDTSASQNGEYRERAITAVESLLSSLPKQATVSLVAIDRDAEPLTAGFVSAGAAKRDGLAALRQRVPLGATDLAAGLKHASAMFATGPTGSVVYIGDGMSAANLLQSGELKSLCDTLRTKRIPVHAYAVGPDTDWRLLGVLAHQTGGVIELEAPGVDPAAVGAQLAREAAAPVLYLESLTASGEGRLLIGDTPPPFRADRETILTGRGVLPAELQLTAGGTRLSLGIDKSRPIDGLPAVRALALAAERTNGLDMPAAGTDLLVATDSVVEQGAENLAAAATAAATANNIDQAKQFLVSLESVDPSGRATERLRTMLAQAEDAVPEDVAPLPAAPVAEDLIGSEIERQRLLTQQLTLETNDVVDQSRQIRQSDPSDALNLLRRQESSVRLATDIDPDARAQLLRRLNNEIVITANLQEKLELDVILRQERLAQIEAEQRMIERMILEEEQLEQLIERVRALMDAGYHGDDAAFEEARVVAQDAVNLRPGNGPAMAALFTSTAADQLNKAFRLRALRNDRLLETLYQVELSHVPFPDEPPVVYPAPEVWKALTERRRKYASVSLETTSPAEDRIREQLDQETELVFPNTPLRQALDFLSDLHDINIIIDEQALTDEGISIEDPVDITLTGISLRSGLKILLEPYGLTYVIEDEVMKITTETLAEEIQSVRVYPVGDLVVPILPPGALGGFGGGGGGGFGGQQGGGGFGGQGGGGFGGGGGGFGGGGMGGMGGGGFFSVPAPALPQDRPADAGRELPKAPNNERPLEDAEMQRLLDGVIGNSTSSIGSARGQAFASVRDAQGESAGKKK